MATIPKNEKAMESNMEQPEKVNPEKIDQDEVNREQVTRDEVKKEVSENEVKETEFKARPEVITFEDVVKAVPALANHRKLVEWAFRVTSIDDVNRVHGKYCATTGIPFSDLLATEEYRWRVKIDNFDILERFKEGPFITVSNHPFGSYDGILLLHIVGKVRKDFKVMVNLILNQLQAMQPSFIAVDPMKSEDHEKRKITMQGLRAAIRHVKEGHPLGFFPAGAISKPDIRFRMQDRQWQPMIIRLIRQLQVPVIPIFFHGRNSIFFNILGMIDWRLRTLRLPRELFASYNKKIRVSIGEPVSVEKQNSFETLDELGTYLREETFKLRDIYRNKP